MSLYDVHVEGATHLTFRADADEETVELCAADDSGVPVVKIAEFEVEGLERFIEGALERKHVAEGAADPAHDLAGGGD